MPTVTETPARLFAHCPRPGCRGFMQREVDGVVVETAYAYTDNGGDIPGTERSHHDYRFADDADRACVECGTPCEVSAQRRPSYDPLSGFDPMGLLQVDAFDPAVKNTVEDEKVAELEAKMAAQQKQIEKLLGKLGGE